MYTTIIASLKHEVTVERLLALVEHYAPRSGWYYWTGTSPGRIRRGGRDDRRGRYCPICAALREAGVNSNDERLAGVRATSDAVGRDLSDEERGAVVDVMKAADLDEYGCNAAIRARLISMLNPT